MNTNRVELEARLQALAEQSEKSGQTASDDPQLDRYRLVTRALRQPLLHDLPEDFAARVLLRIGQAEERSSVEEWLTTLLLLVLAVVGLMVLQPYFGLIIAQLRIPTPNLPWPQLLGSALSIAAVCWLERLWSRAHPQIA